jgi:hypothetical protein
MIFIHEDNFYKYGNLEGNAWIETILEPVGGGVME